MSQLLYNVLRLFPRWPVHKVDSQVSLKQDNRFSLITELLSV